MIEVLKAASAGAITTGIDYDTVLSYQTSAYVPTKANILEVIRKAKAQYDPIPFVHLSTDIWTARNLDSYITMNARFIDLESFQSQNLNLAVRVFNSKHTHENIAAAITEILGEFELDANSDLNSNDITERSEEELQAIEDMWEGIGIQEEVGL